MAFQPTCHCGDCRLCRRRIYQRNLRKFGPKLQYVTQQQKLETAEDIKEIEENFPHLRDIDWNELPKVKRRRKNNTSLQQQRSDNDNANIHGSISNYAS